jgi:hypothetical protein
MICLPICRGVGALAVASLVLSTSFAAETPASRSSTGKQAIPSARPTPTAAKGGARGTLPDPILLDGSTHPAEKKSEYGMIGDFELPGDENARNGRVGGPQAQGQQTPGQQQGGGGGGLPLGLPPTGGGGPQGQQQGGLQPPPQLGGPQGPQNPNAGGKAVEGAGDPNAKAEGIQVAQLGGEASGTPPPGEQSASKPQPVAIGDSAMQIQTAANTPGVVGNQQQVAPNTQQHEKGTGSGGKGPTATGGTNRVEKGRTIPAGL